MGPVNPAAATWGPVGPVISAAAAAAAHPPACSGALPQAGGQRGAPQGPAAETQTEATEGGRESSTATAANTGEQGYYETLLMRHYEKL